MAKNTFFKYKSRLRNTLYHFKVHDYNKLKKYSHEIGLSFVPWFEILKASWMNGASFEDYFELRFFEKSSEQRVEWITTSLRHELTRQVNDPRKTVLLKDKLLFARTFNNLGRKVYSWSDIQTADKNATVGPMVIKPRFGQAGVGIIFAEEIVTFLDLLNFIIDHKIDVDNYVYESFISDQHTILKKINPESLNTIRMVTFCNDGNVEFWGYTLRMGVNSKIDNGAQGGLSAGIQSDGVIRTPAVSKNPFENPYSRHPVTDAPIVGVKIPFWDQAISLVSESAKSIPEVKSIGWDIAIRNEGPCLIEGNDNWSISTQVKIGKGLRPYANMVADMKIVYD